MKRLKKATVLVLIAALCLPALAGCGDTVIGPAPAAQATAAPGSEIAPGGVTAITLNGASAMITGGGASVDGGTVKIASPGEYTISGALDGRIVVNTGEVKGDVTLRLAGAEIRCADGPALLVEQVKNCRLVLEEGSFNRLVSGAEDAAPTQAQDGAVIFSEDDLDIQGGGELEVQGWINNGITCKDDLDILGGVITVVAVHNGVKGSESVEITDGELRVTAGNDGMKSSSAKKEGKGFVTVSGGFVEITAGGDGIAAETALTVSGGELHITTRGARGDASSKGMKAKTELTLSDCRIALNTADHALHCTGDLRVLGGAEIRVESCAGKGLAAHGTLEIADGTIDVTSENDGLDSERAVNISGGEISIFTKGDGIKAGSHGSAEGTFTLSGGAVTVSAFGEVFDAKGSAAVTGGKLIGVGTAKSPKGFSGANSQRYLLFRSFAGAAGSAAQLSSDASGELIGTIEGRCGYTYAVYTAPGLEEGSYHLSYGTIQAAAKAK